MTGKRTHPQKWVWSLVHFSRNRGTKIERPQDPSRVASGTQALRRRPYGVSPGADLPPCSLRSALPSSPPASFPTRPLPGKRRRGILRIAPPYCPSFCGELYLVATCLLLAASWAGALEAPAAVEAFDTPDDAGGNIPVRWPRVADEAGVVYQVAVALAPEGPSFQVAEVKAAPGVEDHYQIQASQYTLPDSGGTASIQNDRSYYFHVDAWRGEKVAEGQVLAQAQAEGNLFNWSKLNNFIIGLSFSFIILGCIALARRRNLYIRRIAGLEALDQALGRATEMGKPVLFIHGLNDMSSVSTIAAVNILGRVARRTAAYDTALRVANNDPVVMAVSQEVVKEAYLEAGRPDAYNPDNVYLAATEQFAYAAALEGVMVRERPAAHIMMGYFYGEALLLAETGSTTGAIQIAGTDSYTQLPFFVTTCDYTLMGEELYAASAYLSREPKLLGSLKGQDIGKAVLIAVLLGGALLATCGVQALTLAFTAH